MIAAARDDIRYKGEEEVKRLRFAHDQELQVGTEYETQGDVAGDLYGNSKCQLTTSSSPLPTSLHCTRCSSPSCPCAHPAGLSGECSGDHMKLRPSAESYCSWRYDNCSKDPPLCRFNTSCCLIHLPSKTRIHTHAHMRLRKRMETQPTDRSPVLHFLLHLLFGLFWFVE